MLTLDFPGIGRRIANYRKQNGMTAAELAGRSGMTREVLANIETGRRNDIGVGQLSSIAWTLRVPLSALLLPIDRPDDVLDSEFTRVIDVLALFQAWPTTSNLIDHTPARSNSTARLAALRQYHDAVREWLAATAAPLSEGADPQASATRKRIQRATANLNEQHAIVAELGIQVPHDLGIGAPRGDN